MTTTLEAVYEQGLLRLKDPLPLRDGTSVQVTVRADAPADPTDYKSLLAKYEKQVTKTPAEVAEIMDAVAALPMEGRTDPFSGREHDDVLYGEGYRTHGA